MPDKPSTGRDGSFVNDGSRFDRSHAVGPDGTYAVPRDAVPPEDPPAVDPDLVGVGDDAAEATAAEAGDAEQGIPPEPS